MPPLRRKKGASPAASASPARVSLARNSPIPQLSPSRSAVTKTPMKSPLRQVRHAGVTKNQKAVLLENLNLEITERAKKLRAQYSMQARALKQRIEMRINRVPKKLWGSTMGELLAQSGPPVIAENSSESISTRSNVVTVQEFVEDLKQLSDGVEEKENPQSARLVVPKKRTTKKTAVASAREQMPPPPIPATANPPCPLALSPSKSNLPPAPTSPTELLSSSPTTRPTAKPSTKATTKITIKVPARTIRKIIPSSGSQVSNSSRASSRATTRSSTDTAVTSAGSSHENSAGTRGTKASQAKSKAAAITPNSGLKRGGVKGIGSNGSLKENRVAGVKEKKAPATKTTKDATAAATGGRVLRSRK